MLLHFLPWIILASALLLSLGAVLAWRRRGRRRRRAQALPRHWALTARPVFTRDERVVYRQLCEALPHHVILAKLPLVRMCQPSDPERVRYWFNLLGATHVGFAICSTHGRVLAAIDIDSGRGNSPRTRQIKQAVLAACRVRYLHCKIEHLPSLPELRALVPDGFPPQAWPSSPEHATPWRATLPLVDLMDDPEHELLSPHTMDPDDERPPLRH